MRTWWVVAGLIACKDSKPSAPPPEPPTPVIADRAIALDAAGGSAVTPAKATPKAKRGFIAYTTVDYDKDGKNTYGPLMLIDAETGTAIETPIVHATDVVGGAHVLAGRSANDQKAWVIDVRAPTLAAAPREQPVEYVTPDDRLVWRCSGGAEQTFTICTSNADGKNAKELFTEPPGPTKDIAVVEAAGRDAVHGAYMFHTRPRFSIALADGKRTDYPDLGGKPETKVPNGTQRAEMFYSPSAAKVAECAKDLVVTTLDGSVKPQTFSLGAEPVRCTCRFSKDDTLLACSILADVKGTEDLHLWTLATEKKAIVVRDISIGEFQFSPDGTELAYVQFKGEVWSLRVSSLDGTATREVARHPSSRSILDVVGWTDPN